MTKVIVEGVENNSEVFDGQVRADESGRIAMIITDKRMESPLRLVESTIRALILREGDGGNAEPFTTIPKVYETPEDVIDDFPLELSATLTIEGGR